MRNQGVRPSPPLFVIARPVHSTARRVWGTRWMEQLTSWRKRVYKRAVRTVGDEAHRRSVCLSTKLYLPLYPTSNIIIIINIISNNISNCNNTLTIVSLSWVASNHHVLAMSELPLDEKCSSTSPSTQHTPSSTTVLPCNQSTK